MTSAKKDDIVLENLVEEQFSQSDLKFPNCQSNLSHAPINKLLEQFSVRSIVTFRRCGNRKKYDNAVCALGHSEGRSVKKLNVIEVRELARSSLSVFTFATFPTPLALK